MIGRSRAPGPRVCPAALLLHAVLAACNPVLEMDLPPIDARARSLMVVVNAPGGASAVAFHRGSRRGLPARMMAGASSAVLLSFELDLASLGLDEGAVQLEGKGRGCPPPLALDVLQGSVSGGRLEWSRSTASGAAPDLRLRHRAGRTLVEPGESLAVDLGCPGRAPCGQVRLTQDACRVDLDASGCARGTITGVIDGLGGFQVESAAELGECRERAAPAGSVFSLECEPPGLRTCRLDAYRPPFPERFAIETRALEGAPLPISASARAVEYPPDGAIRGLVPLPGAVAVAVSASGTFVWTHAPSCGREARHRLLLLDSETMATRTSSEGPGCLTALGRDPPGTGLLAARVGADGVPWLGWLDEEGRTRASASLGPDARAPAGAWVTSVRAVPEPEPAVMVLLARSLGPLTIESAMVLLDWPSLAVRSSVVFEHHVSDVVAAADVLAALEDSGTLHLFRRSGAPADPGRAYLVSLFGVAANRDAGPLGFSAETGSIIAAYVGAETELSVVDPHVPVIEREPRTARVWERPAQATALGPWPADPALALVGLVEETAPFEASLALLDVSGVRLLPGLAPLGAARGLAGPVAYLVADARGRVWFALPWVHVVGRVGPRP